jgi:hypothetical protein
MVLARPSKYAARCSVHSNTRSADDPGDVNQKIPRLIILIDRERPSKGLPIMTQGEFFAEVCHADQITVLVPADREMVELVVPWAGPFPDSQAETLRDWRT